MFNSPACWVLIIEIGCMMLPHRADSDPSHNYWLTIQKIKACPGKVVQVELSMLINPLIPLADRAWDVISSRCRVKVPQNGSSISKMTYTVLTGTLNLKPNNQTNKLKMYKHFFSALMCSQFQLNVKQSCNPIYFFKPWWEHPWL